MKTSLRLLVLSAAIAATASVYAGEGAAYWAQRSQPVTTSQTKVTTPVTDKATVENAAPRPYERGIHPVAPRNPNSTGCSCPS
ncbi:MAG TPA: hypothetical protein VL357_04885 [Rariglobus sp.]|jgi:hypothetical protein|nr:hypothetical protein [Rariglobus sp.]